MEVDRQSMSATGHRSHCPQRSSAGPGVRPTAQASASAGPALAAAGSPCHTSSAGPSRSSAAPHSCPACGVTPACPAGKALPGSTSRNRCMQHLQAAWQAQQAAATPRVLQWYPRMRDAPCHACCHLWRGQFSANCWACHVVVVVCTGGGSARKLICDCAAQKNPAGHRGERG
jgi:hypothetical protein